MRILRLTVLALILNLALAPPAPAQDPVAESLTDAGLNLVFFVDNKWAMYGAPQTGRIDKSAFEALVTRVKNLKFPSTVTQIVVMVHDSEAEGTIGLVEKRGLQVSSQFVDAGGVGPYDIWHAVGYSVNPDKVLTDFQENVLAAEGTYHDLPLTFSGQVRRVGKDAGGQVFVEFALRSPVGGLVCYPWAEAPQRVDLRSLRSGDRLKVSGQFTEVADNYIKLRGCLFSR